MDIFNKIVQFDKYCEKCIHYDKDQSEFPCDDCLSNPTNINSNKPIYFKEKEKTVQPKNKEEQNESND